MSEFRRDYFELKRAEAMDIADPRSFAVHRKTSLFNRSEHKPRKAFCTLHSNRNCSECKKKRYLAQKRRRQRKLGMDLLVNDFHGFNWIDPKVNEHQTLNISGKSMGTTHDIFNTGGVFQNNRLFFPELALNRPILLTEQAGIYRKEPRERNKKLEGFKDKEMLPVLPVLPGGRKESFEDEKRLPVLDTNPGLNIGSPSELKVLESTNKEKRRINIVLPRISQEIG